MHNHKNKLLLIALLIASHYASATTIDLRHQYVDSGVNADRVMISQRFKNGIGFTIESKWITQGDDKEKPFNGITGNGHEESLSWQLKASNNIFVTPGMFLLNEDDAITYRPFLRVQYNLNNDLFIATRYRYEYKQETEDNNTENTILHRGDIWIGYKINNWNILLNYIYRYSNDQLLSNNKNYSNEYNAKFMYQLDSQWSPYIEVGNVSGNAHTDERQTRYRVGIVFQF